MVTHSAESAAMADRVYELHAGKLMAARTESSIDAHGPQGEGAA
jgi:hypothetical protein